MKVKLFLIFVFVSHFFYAQVDRNSILGLPNVTTVQMNGIATPNEGSIVYNTTDDKIYYWDGTRWVAANESASDGDVKFSVATADHSGWYILDGRSIATLSATAQAVATSLGFTTNLPNATDRVLKHPAGGENIGDTGGQANTTLVQANLPNVNFTGTTNTRGNHRHGFAGFFSNQRVQNGVDANRRILLAGGNTNTSNAGNHNHNVTLNSGGANQSFDRYQPYLVINTFIYLGN
ncbi:microcystin-dependent protein [Aquimarina sp. EL_43]|uniref:hypothetical protein n=1 Tax=Aquimarina TaxID=290174 RepID=UPI0004B12261|nr:MULTISPECIES: hypothetical protein [Aquimarina]MBG6132307.1 microcystin-dependent protein [Aquimarina sp. EL_35]MBG6152438.1 microcystin-dependent protein [Aquimarina sp. EL_32]MBG6170635.1 microcystin-dependent protein [Aquimarina sp. EL_43]